MASSILVRSLLEQVSRHLTDFAPQFERWTQSELLSYLRDAQVAIAKYMPTSCSRIDVIKLSPGTRQSIALIPAASLLPGDGSTPVETRGNALLSVNCLMGATGTTTGRALRLVDLDTLNEFSPNWRAASAYTLTPTQFAYDPRTPKNFFMSPGVASSANVWAEVSYLADPAPIPPANYSATGGATAVISIDDKFADDIVNYMLARCYMKEAEYAANASMASTHTNLFTASINAQATALTGVNPNLTALPLTPGVPAAAR